MVINYKKLELINFPIYGLNSSNVEVVDGLLRDGGFVIDDRNQIGDTLGARRLQTAHELYPLRRSYEDIASMLQGRDKVFVDSKGYCFIYQKTKFMRIEYHKIIKTVMRDDHSILSLYRVPFPVKVQRPPPEGKEWVGMLYYNKHPWLPYEYSESYCTTIRKKV